MDTASLDYVLPAAAIAQEPAEPRDAARLLVAGPDSSVEHRTVGALAEMVAPGDVVVVNDTAVLPARLRASRPTGGRVEVLLLEERSDGAWEALVRPGRKVAPDTELIGDGFRLRVGADLGAGRRVVRAVGTPMSAVMARGEVPLPPYITRALEDPSRYQTVFARDPVSVAAPTAGLHLTRELLDALATTGARIERVQLAVGLDTFRPITTDRVESHVIHTEAYTVSGDTLDACDAAARVIAIGTTVVRALETAARHGPGSGRSSLFIRPPFDFRVVDALLTNFHVPRSSLLALVEAFTGSRWRHLYGLALAEGYRFLSFGDAMFVEREAT